MLSALDQPGVELEVIVVDDASTPPASAVADAIGDSRIRVIRLPERRGVAAARNAGLARAKGRWVAFLDDDDEWQEGKLAAQLEALEISGARWAWCATSMVRGDGTPVYDKLAPRGDEIGALLLDHNAVPGSASSVVADTSLVREIGGFDEQLPHLADWDLWLRLADTAPGVGCEEILVTQRIHAGGMSSRDTRGAWKEFSGFRARHPDVGSRNFTRWTAGTHWRAGRRLRAIRDLTIGRLRYRG